MKLDCHVHIIGDGSSGSGCTLNLRGIRELHGRIMARTLGVPFASIGREFDRLYVELLLKMVRGSSIDRLVILAQEKPYDDNGKPVEGFSQFYVPNEYVLDLARRYPEDFVPAVSIHPRRPDAMEELERCFAGGARVMKCLPLHQNINCSDKRFTKFWERMAEARMALLAHTGGELSVPVFNKAYANPEVLTLPLECGVIVIAAHCASNSFLDKNYFPVFRRMLERFPRLYGDNSAFSSPLRSLHLGAALEVKDRIIHGSDVPIPVSATWAALQGYFSWSEARTLNAIDNAVETDFFIKQKVGFPESCATRLAEILAL